MRYPQDSFYPVLSNSLINPRCHHPSNRPGRYNSKKASNPFRSTDVGPQQGLHPPRPLTRAHSRQVPRPPSEGTNSQSLLLGGLALQNLLLSGTHVARPSFNRICLTILFWGSPGRLVIPKGIQPHVTREAFLGHAHHCSSTPSSDRRRPPGALSPMALPECPLPSCLAPSLQCPLQGHQELLPT